MSQPFDLSRFPDLPPEVLKAFAAQQTALEAARTSSCTTFWFSWFLLPITRSTMVMLCTAMTTSIIVSTTSSAIPSVNGTNNQFNTLPRIPSSGP